LQPWLHTTLGASHPSLPRISGEETRKPSRVSDFGSRVPSFRFQDLGLRFIFRRSVEAPCSLGFRPPRESAKERARGIERERARDTETDTHIERERCRVSRHLAAVASDQLCRVTAAEESRTIFGRTPGTSKGPYRGTSPISKIKPLGPYSRTIPWVLW